MAKVGQLVKASKLTGFFSMALAFSMGGPAVSAEPASPAKPATSSPAPASKQVKINNLFRADFKLSGASCVACVRRCGRVLRSQKGVVKADVSIFKPHWGIVIYDKDVTNMDKLYDVLKAQEKVKFEDIDDQKISEVPLIVIPKGMKIDTPTVGKH